jgi:dTDP-L-rhamnose 4-epimerase
MAPQTEPGEEGARSMRVLVTGGAGFIGSHTVDLLLDRGYQVRILDSIAVPVHRDGTLPDYVDSRAEFVKGDVRDRQAWLTALDGMDAVIHLAAYQDYLPDFSTFFDVNCVGTALLYELIVDNNLPVRKVVVASSQAVYGEGSYACRGHGTQYPGPRTLEQLERGQWDVTCPVCGRVMECQPTGEEKANPHNQYAISKYAQELICLRLGERYQIPTVAMRYSITQGPRQSPHNAYSGILRIFTTRLLAGRSPEIYEDGGQLRDYVSVSDVAQANLLVLHDARADYRAFNVGSGQAMTVLDYAQLLMKTLGVDKQVIAHGQFRLGDTRHIVSDISQIRRLGWEPQDSLPDIMRRYAEWMRSQPGVDDASLGADRIMRDKGVVRQAQMQATRDAH